MAALRVILIANNVIRESKVTREGSLLADLQMASSRLTGRTMESLQATTNLLPSRFLSPLVPSPQQLLSRLRVPLTWPTLTLRSMPTT